MRLARNARSPRSTGKLVAAVLAVAVNLGFIAFIVFSVTWQNRKETPVSVELYAPPAAATNIETPKLAEPAPTRPEPPPSTPVPPKPQPAPRAPEPEASKPQPEPPKPVTKVAPPLPPSKAEIALKAKRDQAERARIEKEKHDAEQRVADKREADKREADKREAERKQQDDKRLADARERQAREAEALKAQAERERVATAKAADSAQAKAMDDYIRRIQSRIKGNVVLPPDLAGNPEAVFEVLQLPTGEIIDVQLKKSSGVRAYDEAVQRAIIKASPLPKPEVADLFRRSLTLKFRPLD